MEAVRKDGMVNHVTKNVTVVILVEIVIISVTDVYLIYVIKLMDYVKTSLDVNLVICTKNTATEHVTMNISVKTAQGSVIV